MTVQHVIAQVDKEIVLLKPCPPGIWCRSPQSLGCHTDLITIVLN
ncbi:hypothetical protein KM043_018881, partial [Ampulex compressa]